jgi:hypothetical protein
MISIEKNNLGGDEGIVQIIAQLGRPVNKESRTKSHVIIAHSIE